MVICAACKAYTDDQQPTCQQCGAPLQPDRMERIAALARDPVVAQLAEDQEQALLVASAVVAAHRVDFLFDDGRGQRTVLAELFGSGVDPNAATAAVIFAAYAYLEQHGACRLAWEAKTKQVSLTALGPWDGQQACLERMLAAQAARAATTAEATEGVLRELMDFEPVLVRVRSADGSRARRAPQRSAPAAVDQAARLTTLPPHERKEACRSTYLLLKAFIEANRERSKQLALETLRLLDQLASFQVAG
ncbi:MAG: hypothetical protein GX601_10905 [Anaerolineales bacterium]|nr:hypothetical protein [Anaerolineales bacterium]